jgi:hypothetical protein
MSNDQLAELKKQVDRIDKSLNDQISQVYRDIEVKRSIVQSQINDNKKMLSSKIKGCIAAVQNVERLLMEQSFKK